MSLLPKLRSYARLTDLMFAQFSGSLLDRDTHLVIRTPKNPGFHWGNYLILDQPPERTSLPKWKALFDKEFADYPSIHHRLFTWDSPEVGDPTEFLKAGYELSSSTVLTSNSPLKPPRPNSAIQLRRLSSDADWKQAVDLQVLCADIKYQNAHYRPFKERQMDNYRKMAESGRGAWFGAYLDSQLVGDLGLFHEGGLGRYQSVETHPEFRRQGVCATLVCFAGNQSLEEKKCHTLVMEADLHYHAARVYESVGFQPAEINHALTWWQSP